MAGKDQVSTRHVRDKKCLRGSRHLTVEHDLSAIASETYISATRRVAFLPSFPPLGLRDMPQVARIESEDGEEGSLNSFIEQDSTGPPVQEAYEELGRKYRTVDDSTRRANVATAISISVPPLSPKSGSEDSVLSETPRPSASARHHRRRSLQAVSEDEDDLPLVAPPSAAQRRACQGQAQDSEVYEPSDDNGDDTIDSGMALRSGNIYNGQPLYDDGQTQPAAGSSNPRKRTLYSTSGRGGKRRRYAAQHSEVCFMWTIIYLSCNLQ